MSQKIESKFQQQQQTSNQQKDNSETGQDQIRIEQQQEGKEISPSNTPTQYEINTQENVENPIKETKQEEDQHHSTLETSTKLNIQDPAQDRNEPAAQLIQRVKVFYMLLDFYSQFFLFLNVAFPNPLFQKVDSLFFAPDSGIIDQPFDKWVVENLLRFEEKNVIV